MKIELNYDPKTGEISDQNGTTIVFWPDLENHVSIGAQLREGLGFDSVRTVDDLIKLKDAGFTAEEIIAMSSRKVI